MIDRARAVVLEARDKGWSGPPFDPLLLAEHLNIPVVPREDVEDAQTVPNQGSVLIEFNPHRPRGRMRYSVAHEIAHTLFPDCSKQVRHRLKRDEIEGDDWQLELLCNVGAAEMLMPVGSFPDLAGEVLTVDHLMELRKQFDVSAEAIFLRVVRLTDQPCAMFVASRDEAVELDGSYRLDYALGSRTWAGEPPRGLTLPPTTVVAECTAIGYTAKRDEEWPGIKGKLHVECVGIPPYPQRRYPRVVGVAMTRGKGSATGRQIIYLKGDATDPRGDGHRIVAHIVNDKTPNWGAGFALAVRRKWPTAQEDFQHWARTNPKNLALGNTHRLQVAPDLSLFHMVSQHGYGPSTKPRIRYQALHECLTQLAETAHNSRASVHMPRIGCGEAGGDWEIVSELVDDALCKRGVAVTVYDLPGRAPPAEPAQARLF